MQLVDSNALSNCIQDAVSKAMQCYISTLKQDPADHQYPNREKLWTKQQMASELDISLVSLTQWMKRGMIPYLRLGKRVYFKKWEVIEAMLKWTPNKEGWYDGN